MDELDRLREKFDESHRLLMRILDIIEYSNLQDLKTINRLLDENGFITEKEQNKIEESL